MDRVLVRLAARSHLKNRIGKEKNHLKVSIYRKNKNIKLAFLSKPPSSIRKQVRLIGFTWNRKYHIWIAYMNDERIQDIKKLYQFINKKN